MKPAVLAAVIAKIPFQSRLIQPIGLALALSLGSLALQVPAFSEESAGALEGYLASPVAGWERKAGLVPCRTAIPKYQESFRTAEREYDKGVAVANLAAIALELARKKQTKPVARELCEQWVMPNLDTTLTIEQTNSCCWRRTLMRCANIHRLTQNSKMEKQCLAMLHEANRREGDQDLATFLLAFHHARQGQHHEAIRTIRSLEGESPYASNRGKLIRNWQKQIRKEEKERKRQLQLEQKRKQAEKNQQSKTQQ
ncbi:MAG: hypothetical protein R3242_01810 [Akkermansiaceae bacterium]|nr:hypothetical protein [Akkermansiaceae bacterium]